MILMENKIITANEPRAKATETPDSAICEIEVAEDTGALVQSGSPPHAGSGGMTVCCDSDDPQENIIRQLEGIDAKDYLRVKSPTGMSTSMVVSDAFTGETELKEAKLIILAARKHRARYPEDREDGDRLPALCVSPNAQNGFGDPGVACSTCMYSQFGSAKNGKAQGCRLMTDLSGFREGHVVPETVTFSPTSEREWKRYELTLKMDNRQSYEAVSQLQYKTVVSGTRKYPVAVLRGIRRLTPEEAKFFARCAQIVQTKVNAMVAEMIATLNTAKK